MDNPFLLGADGGGKGVQPSNLQLATVAGVYTDGLSLIPDDQAAPTQKHYRYLNSAYPSPAIGDRVVVMKMSGTYVVMGAIGGSSDMPTANTVYAGPASGGAASAAFRSLVAADLPIVPINKGGSGQSEVYYTADISEICTTNSDCTISSAVYAQWGKLASVGANVTFTKASSSTSDDTTAFTLVEGKRPRITTLARAWRNANAILYFNGNMVYHGLATSGTSTTLLATYLLA